MKRWSKHAEYSQLLTPKRWQASCMSIVMQCAKDGGLLARPWGQKIWTRYSGHCFSHLNWNVDMGEKIGHIFLNMREKSMETASQGAG